jgi:hypothetical protein
MKAGIKRAKLAMSKNLIPLLRQLKILLLPFNLDPASKLQFFCNGAEKLAGSGSLFESSKSKCD